MSSQIFPKWANVVPGILLISIVVILGTVVHLFWFWFSPKHLNVGYQPNQPIPFSHALHVDDNVGLDCRYCHSNVEKAAHSNIPATETCMNCHKQIKTDSPHIKKLTAHYESGNQLNGLKYTCYLIMCILIIPHTSMLAFHVFNATAKLIRWMLFIKQNP